MNKKKQTEMDLKKGVEKATPWDPKVINFMMFSKPQYGLCSERHIEIQYNSQSAISYIFI